MTKLILRVFIVCICGIASACPPDEKMIKSAMEQLYADEELVNYICIENKDCDLNEFSSKLDLTRPDLNPSSKKRVEALLAEPTKKNKQYFSALFIKTGCMYQMALSPDTSLSGIKIIKKNRKKLNIIRSLERETNELWKETDYGYDPKLKQFIAIRTRCYRDQEGNSISRTCE